MAGVLWAFVALFVLLALPLVDVCGRLVDAWRPGALPVAERAQDRPADRWRERMLAWRAASTRGPEGHRLAAFAAAAMS